jgi:hypothetical protein
MKAIEAKKLQPGQMVRLKSTHEYVRVNYVDIFGKRITIITRDAKAKVVNHNDIEHDTRPPETRGTWE